MENEKIQRLQAWGCDTQAALERLDGDEALYLECLALFCEDENFHGLAEAIHGDDAQSAFRFAHTLKGVAVNFGILPLLDAVSGVVEPLRNGRIAEAQAAYGEFQVKKQQYDAIILDK